MIHQISGHCNSWYDYLIYFIDVIFIICNIIDVTYTSDGSIDPLLDMVASQYQRYRYPEPVIDIPSWLEKKWQLFDPSHSHLLFWPDREKLNELDILVAGCGTNQAALLAYTNPTAKVKKYLAFATNKVINYYLDCGDRCQQTIA